ncbi:MAG: zinc ABC transporter solute-binding protein [Candidatus Hydrogenedens sp.]|nr:zinc ABC transporter solute-binding protein [Candidatus Hydrogenedens sp.]
MKKHMASSLCLAFFAVMATLLTACGGFSQKEGESSGTKQSNNSPIDVIVSIVPQAWVVDKIGGDLVKTEVLAPPNHSPETYQITPRQMDALGRAALYFRIGMPFEEALVQRLHTAFPGLAIVDTRKDVPLLALVGHHHHHDDGHDHDHHHHGDEDPHIWLDPIRVKIQAHTVAEALIRALPEQESVIQEKLKALEEELDALHEELTGLLAPLENRIFFVYHPAFGYFADRYELTQKAVEFEGKSPGAQRLYGLIDEIKESGTTAIFTQPQFNVAELSAIASSAGVEMVMLDNLLYDYPHSMRLIAGRVAEVLRKEAGPSSN